MKNIPELIAQILELSLDGIFVEDSNGIILTCNEAGCAMFGYTKEEMTGMPASRLLSTQTVSYMEPFYTKYRLQKNEYKEQVKRRKDGTLFPASVTYRTLVCDGQTYRVAYLRDLTYEMQVHNELFRLAHFDELTGLLNRHSIIRVMENKEAPYAAAMLDLDYFKQINDTYGHLMGDQFLEAFGRLLKSSPHMDSGRFGGEEFLLLFHTPDLNEASKDLELLQQKSACLFPEYGGIRFSGGLILVEPGMTLNHALASMDKLLYQAKKLGRNKVVAA